MHFGLKKSFVKVGQTVSLPEIAGRELFRSTGGRAETLSKLAVRPIQRLPVQAVTRPLNPALRQSARNGETNPNL
jgi:hypothetical protein